MNLKTTIVLLALILLGALGWLAVGLLNRVPPSSETLVVLEKELTPDKLTRIEVVRGDRRVVLEKGTEGWSLPGKWPVRKPEVDRLVDLLTNLRMRFAAAGRARKSGIGESRTDGGGRAHGKRPGRRQGLQAHSGGGTGPEWSLLAADLSPPGRSHGGVARRSRSGRRSGSAPGTLHAAAALPRRARGQGGRRPRRNRGAIDRQGHYRPEQGRSRGRGL